MNFAWNEINKQQQQMEMENEEKKTNINVFQKYGELQLNSGLGSWGYGIIESLIHKNDFMNVF